MCFTRSLTHRQDRRTGQVDRFAEQVDRIAGQHRAGTGGGNKKKQKIEKLLAKFGQIQGQIQFKAKFNSRPNWQN